MPAWGLPFRDECGTWKVAPRDQVTVEFEFRTCWTVLHLPSSHSPSLISLPPILSNTWKNTNDKQPWQWEPHVTCPTVSSCVAFSTRRVFLFLFFPVHIFFRTVQHVCPPPCFIAQPPPYCPMMLWLPWYSIVWWPHLALIRYVLPFHVLLTRSPSVLTQELRATPPLCHTQAHHQSVCLFFLYLNSCWPGVATPSPPPRPPDWLCLDGRQGHPLHAPTGRACHSAMLHHEVMVPNPPRHPPATVNGWRVAKVSRNSCMPVTMQQQWRHGLRRHNDNGHHDASMAAMMQWERDSRGELLVIPNVFIILIDCNNFFAFFAQKNWCDCHIMWLTFAWLSIDF